METLEWIFTYVIVPMIGGFIGAIIVLTLNKKKIENMAREEDSVKEYVAISDHRDYFIEGAECADNNSKLSWISVKEKLPPEGEYGLSIRVLVLNTDKKISFGRYDYDAERWLGPGRDMKFTHWMLLPEPPKTEN